MKVLRKSSHLPFWSLELNVQSGWAKKVCTFFCYHSIKPLRGKVNPMQVFQQIHVARLGLGRVKRALIANVMPSSHSFASLGKHGGSYSLSLVIPISSATIMTDLFGSLKKESPNETKVKTNVWTPCSTSLYS